MVYSISLTLVVCKIINMCEIIKHEILKISSEFKCDRVSDISHLSVFWFLTEMQIYYVQLAVLAEIKGHLKN